MGEFCKRIDLTGVRFGRLVVVSFSHICKSGQAVWFCKCECGKVIKREAENLKNRISPSCGCRYRTAGGRSKSATYASWLAMMHRCENPKRQFFYRYGGRGIGVCERWRKFENFYADMGDRPSGTSLDRINNEGNYEPRNCRWATPTEQANNKSRSLRFCYNGIEDNARGWSRRLGIKYSVLKDRIYRGWSFERAITQKVRGGIGHER